MHLKGIILASIACALSIGLMTEAQMFYSQGLDNIFRRVKDYLFTRIDKTSTGRGLRRAETFNRVQPSIDRQFSFPCDVRHGRSPIRPTSVHQLRPGDIDVVGSIGDSLTSANGAAATGIFHLLTENRGLSAFGGGQGTWREFLTIPNILKEFNPNLIGYSLGDSLGHHKASQFNVAEPAALIQDSYFMAKELVQRIKNDKRVNFKKDWKLITVFIGANDFCSNNCFLSPAKFENIAEIHRRDLIKAFDYLRDNMPRTFVNLVLLPNLKTLHDLKGLPAQCTFFQMFECPCLFGLPRKASYSYNIKKQAEWQRVQKQVANDPRYRTKEDFAVVLQPFAAKIQFPLNGNGITDFTYLSEDCFHLSQKGYARVANAVWNNMLEPLGQKSTGWSNAFSKFLCPTEKRPFLFTHGNSNISYSKRIG